MEDRNTSIVIPAYNAFTTLPILIQRIRSVFLLHKDIEFEVIIVDDGSRDGSWELISHFAKEDPRIAGIKLGYNMGQPNATLVGIRYARYPIVITMDDDLQHPPESIIDLIDALVPNFDLVYAEPMYPVQSNIYRLLVLCTKYILSIIVRAPHIRHMRSFRAFRNELYPWANVPLNNSYVVDGILRESHPRTTTIKVEYALRNNGTSTYSLYRSFSLAIAIWRSRTPCHLHKQTPLPISDFAGRLHNTDTTLHNTLP